MVDLFVYSMAEARQCHKCKCLTWQYYNITKGDMWICSECKAITGPWIISNVAATLIIPKL